jgi:multisubunit Na+/H+ antiporter MnhC subunit
VTLILTSIAILVAFVAVWLLVVVPAERRHHERKLEMVRKRIAQREATRTADEESGDNDSVKAKR